VRVVNASEPDVMALGLSLGALMAVVLGIVGIFWVLVFGPDPDRRCAHPWAIARFGLTTVLSGLIGIGLFVIFYGLSYARGGAAVVIVGTCVRVLAMVISVASLFAAVVLTPVRRGATFADAIGA
jgi:hypothetical protein